MPRSPVSLPSVSASWASTGRQTDGTPSTWVAPDSSRNRRKRRGQVSTARGTGTTAAPEPNARPMSSSEKSNWNGEVVATRESGATAAAASRLR